MELDVGQSLLRLRAALPGQSPSPDVNGLALDVLDHLMKLHEGGRLTSQFLVLALEALKEIPSVQILVEPLVKWATEQARAAGYDDARPPDSPWISTVRSDS